MIVASANGRRVMRRSLLVSTALSTVLLASVGTAVAADLEISTATTDPVSTNVGDGGGPGDINITTSGSVTLDAADGAVAAVTLDSATESISNLGTIVAGAGANEGENLGQNGILVTTATSGGIVTGNVKTGTTQVVDGTGAITTFGVGADAAVLVQASLGTGISSGDSVSTIASSTNPYALLIQENGSAITIDVVDGTDTDLDYGIVNTGSIFSIGYVNGTPATAIGMIGSAGNAVNVLGMRNTGVVQGTSNEDSATGIFVGDTATLGDGTHTGILNVSTGRILSLVTASTTSGVSTAILVGANGTITDIDNSGVIQGSTSGTVGGDAFGIDVDALGTLPTITNNTGGSISASAAADGTNATAIRDQSGTLAQITNAGSILTSATATGRAIAIDLSTGAGVTTIDNSGTINGEILFGGGTYTLNSTAGTITTKFTTTGGTADLFLTGTATLNGSSTLAGGGTLNADFATGTRFVGTADNFEVSDVTFHAGSTFSVTYDPLSVAVPGQIVADNATFEDGSTVNVNLTNYLGATPKTLTLVTTTSSLNFVTAGDTSGIIIGGIGAGYNAALATANAGADLEISLSRKTAAELGLSTNATVLYDASVAALESDQAFGAAVGNIGTVAGVVSLYEQMLPDLSSAREMQSIRMQDVASGMISDRLDMMRTTEQGAGDGGGKYYERYRRAGFWLQESVSQETSDTASNGAQAYDGTMYALAAGYDSRDKKGDVWGASLSYAAMSYSAGTSIQDNLTQSTVGQVYYSMNRNSLFWDTIGSLGWNSYDSERVVTAGAVVRTANANWTGYQAGVTSQVGFSGVFGPITVRPSIGASYLFLSQEGYSETGGGGAALSIDSSTFSSLRANAQMRISGIFGKEPQLVPYVRGGFSQELMDGKPEANGHFNASGATFALNGAELDKSTPFFGAGLSFVGGYSRLSLEYTGQLGSKFTSHQGVATASLMF